jgi:hypothetical protein
MTWFKVSLTKDQVESKAIEKIRIGFRKLYVKKHTPQGMALFLGKPEWDNRQIYTIYFSPVASQFAQDLISSYSGVPCEQPKKESVNIIGGCYDDLTIFI